jgi:hypothetical protein
MNNPAKVRIKEITTTAPFRYLWLKYVSGVDLNSHCAECLLGDNSELVSPALGLAGHNLDLDEYPGEIFYLCGVSKPYNWDRNFHLAFRLAQGEEFSCEEQGISLTLLNAERINFEAFDARNRSSSPNRTKPVFNTCRIWIFANHAQQAGLLG